LPGLALGQFGAPLPDVHTQGSRRTLLPRTQGHHAPAGRHCRGSQRSHSAKSGTTYWVNPGDFRRADHHNWHLPPGWTAGQHSVALSKRCRSGRDEFRLRGSGRASSATVTGACRCEARETRGRSQATVMWLVCSGCLHSRGKRIFRSRSPEAGRRAARQTTEMPALFAQAARPKAAARFALARRLWMPANKRFAVLGRRSGEACVGHVRAKRLFYPYTDGAVEAAAPPSVGTTDKGAS
jgi:hypothetical protein